MKLFLGISIISLGCLMCAPLVSAMVILTGEGSAVTTVDRGATFNALDINYTSELNIYTEDNLSITSGGQSWGADPPLSPSALDPFHLQQASSAGFFAIAYGTEEWVTIKTTDLKQIYGLEFLYGNTWSTGDIYGNYPWGNSSATLEFQEWKGETVVSTGTMTPLGVGTVVGFYDQAGFDQLWVRATTPGNGNLQALALDNLNVQLEPTSIPEPSTLLLVSGALSCLVLFGRRSRA